MWKGPYGFILIAWDSYSLSETALVLTPTTWDCAATAWKCISSGMTRSTSRAWRQERLCFDLWLMIRTRSSGSIKKTAFFTREPIWRTRLGARASLPFSTWTGMVLHSIATDKKVNRDIEGFG